VAADHTVRISQCPLESTGTERSEANSGENLHLLIYRQITPWNSLSEAPNSLVNQFYAFMKMFRRKWVK